MKRLTKARGRALRALFAVTVIGLFLPTALFADPATPSDQIVGLEFQDLSKIEVTSVSKREETWLSTPASIYVITSEDIRRSSARTIPDLLRDVPGLDVAQTSQSSWAISTRGFNSTTANYLLVLIDGRSVYSPLYSGVFWDVQDVALSDIDRIEIIRGPGASVWGANAVNGVINIIRKSSDQTHGVRVGAGGGTEWRAFGGARVGGSLGQTGHYRVYGKAQQSDDFTDVNGHGANDQWTRGQGGFRTDFYPNERDTFMFSSDVYNGDEGANFNIAYTVPPYSVTHHGTTNVNGGNAMGRWSRQLSNDSNFSLQTYYDRTYRHIPLVFTEQRDTGDIDFQHQFRWSPRNVGVWGVTMRASKDYVRDYWALDFDPNSATTRNYGLFLQDEFRPINKLALTLGSKFERNNYTGGEFEPNARVAWEVGPQDTLWGAVSRAVRTPTRYDRELSISGVTSIAPLTVGRLRGDDDFHSETLVAYEVGYRSQPTQKVYYDVSSFYNVYDNLATIEKGEQIISSDPPPTHALDIYRWRNNRRAESYGVEFAPQVNLTNWWRIKAQYSYLHLRTHLENNSNDIFTTPPQGKSPVNQASLKTSFNLPRHFEVDGTVRYVDNLPTFQIGSYTTADARIGWRGIKHLNIEVVGQNLLQPRHVEFPIGSGPTIEIERGVYGRVTLDMP